MEGYDNYKDSGIEWVGTIPINWNSIPAGGVFTEVKRKNKDLVYDNPLSFRYGEIVDKKVNGTADGEGLAETLSAYTIVEPNTIMLNGLNLNYDFISQRVAIVQKQGIITSAYLAVKPDERFLVPRFILYQLKAYDYKMVFHGIGSGIRKTLKFSDFKNIKLALPDIGIQKKIADYLDSKCSDIDSAISDAKASIEEYKKLKQAIITQAVTTGLDPDAKMKDSGIEFIGAIPSDWRICKLRHIGTPQNGISKGGEFFGSGYPFVSYGDVYRNYSLPREVHGLILSTEDEQERYSVHAGDIFFTRTSETIEEVGFSSICEETIENATFAGFLIRVRPFNDWLETGFAKYYFRSSHLRHFLSKEMNLVTRASLGQELLKAMPVLLPSKSEQIDISKYLDNKVKDIDGAINLKENTVNELEAYKKSLIFEVVTGKRKVV